MLFASHLPPGQERRIVESRQNLREEGHRRPDPNSNPNPYAPIPMLTHGVCVKAIDDLILILTPTLTPQHQCLPMVCETVELGKRRVQYLLQQDTM